MTYKIRSRRESLPAGRYYIGDPCYVIPDEEWHEALDSTRYFNLFVSGNSGEYNRKDDMNGHFERDGVLFAASSTAYGDGCYPCKQNGSQVGSCGVDAGLIAAIPLSMIDEDAVDESYSQGLEGLGCIVDMPRPFSIGYVEGTIIFGDVEVQTGDDVEDEDDWYECEEEDDDDY